MTLRDILVKPDGDRLSPAGNLDLEFSEVFASDPTSNALPGVDGRRVLGS